MASTWPKESSPQVLAISWAAGGTSPALDVAATANATIVKVIRRIHLGRFEFAMKGRFSVD
jgi:hypothetical protein